MSKTVKNLLLGFTLVCAIALFVFCIELIVINRDASAGGTGGSSAATSSPSPSPSPSQSGTPGGEGSSPIVPGTKPPPDSGASGAGNGSQDEVNDPPPSPTGKRYELWLPGNEMLIVHADEGLFDYSEGESDWFFTYTQGGAMLEISFVFVSAAGVEARANTFLDNYLDGGSSTVGGEGPIKRSSIRGVYVTGVKGAETYEAWLHSLARSGNSDLALVFVINYRSDEQKNALYTILDTMEIRQRG